MYHPPEGQLSLLPLQRLGRLLLFPSILTLPDQIPHSYLSQNNLSHFERSGVLHVLHLCDGDHVGSCLKVCVEILISRPDHQCQGQPPGPLWVSFGTPIPVGKSAGGQPLVPFGPLWITYHSGNIWVGGCASGVSWTASQGGFDRVSLGLCGLS